MQPVRSTAAQRGRETAEFRRRTLAPYESNPDFLKVCKIGNRRDLPDGFAFSLVCTESAGRTP